MVCVGIALAFWGGGGEGDGLDAFFSRICISSGRLGEAMAKNSNVNEKSYLINGSSALGKLTYNFTYQTLTSHSITF